MALPVLTIAQMREWEQVAWASGQNEKEVIWRVGVCVAEHALRLTHPEDLILILAGKGNNGADAASALKHLTGRRAEVFEVQDAATDLPKLEESLARKPALLIDGLFGIGLNRPLSPEWTRFIQRVNEAHLRVLSVDVPSGLNADNGEPQGAAIQASVTLTVGSPKTGLLLQNAWPFVGRLEVASDVGLGPCPHGGEVKWTTARDFADFPPPRPAATHKGTYGHLAILSGSLGYHGAAVLAARGAQRAQPGLITLYTLESVYHSIAPQLQAVMVSPWHPDVKLPGTYSAILIGPGLAAPDATEQLKMVTRHLWRDAALPVIVDASALDWLPLDTGPKNALRVITPHPGEAARLVSVTAKQVQANRFAALRNVSRRFGNTWVVLKGHQTLIGRSTGEIFVNPSGNPHLAQGGSGDVLSGYLAGLLTQPGLRADALKTIRYAVWQHGAAADLLQASRRNWVVEDLVEGLGTADPALPAP
jgi:hydroxyethylthiazole kinase-like uncharacterized protein yjeF